MALRTLAGLRVIVIITFAGSSSPVQGLRVRTLRERTHFCAYVAAGKQLGARARDAPTV